MGRVEIPEGAIRYACNFRDAFMKIPYASEVDKILNVLSIVVAFPEIAGYYDPIYPAARPSVPVRSIFAGSYVIFYDYNAEDEVVDVYYLRRQREGLRKPFDSLGL